MIVIDDNINDKSQIDNGKRWQSTSTVDVGIRTPNESNDPFCGHLLKPLYLDALVDDGMLLGTF